MWVLLYSAIKLTPFVFDHEHNYRNRKLRLSFDALRNA